MREAEPQDNNQSFVPPNLGRQSITCATLHSLEVNNVDFIFLGYKITVDSDCSHEIKRCLLLGRKAITNLDSILKSRDITLLTKVSMVKALVFPVVVYVCESWAMKKGEH